jgi:hypothetical protein
VSGGSGENGLSTTRRRAHPLLGQPGRVRRPELGRRQGVQPLVVLGAGQVQRPAVEPGHDDGPVHGQRLLDIRRRQACRTHTHSEAEPALILGLDGQEPVDDRHHRTGGRPGEQLRAEAGGQCRGADPNSGSRCHPTDRVSGDRQRSALAARSRTDIRSGGSRGTPAPAGRGVAISGRCVLGSRSGECPRPRCSGHTPCTSFSPSPSAPRIRDRGRWGGVSGHGRRAAPVTTAARWPPRRIPPARWDR